MKENAEDSTFFEKVYAVVRRIPRGRVTTYGAIARYLGTGRSARMVGWALNNSHGLYPPVPAQRVVNRVGLLSGRLHFPTPTLMADLLRAEGVPVEEEQVVDFGKYFWDPAESAER